MRGVLSRIRLPLVVSLFVAALLGGPCAGALPVPVTVTTATVTVTPVAAPALPEPLSESQAAVAAHPVVAHPVAPPVGPVAAPPPVDGTSPALIDQARAAAVAPRAPPFTA